LKLASDQSVLTANSICDFQTRIRQFELNSNSPESKKVSPQF